MASFIYPVVVAWTWGYGRLSNLFDSQVVDVAGSGIVNITGSVSVLEPRSGRFVNPGQFDAHSLPLVVRGTLNL